MNVHACCAGLCLLETRRIQLTVVALFCGPQTYARAAVAKIGYEVESSAYWCHDLITCALSALPYGIVQSQTFSMHLGLRKRALKKEEANKSS